jgi:hypothetical protein
MVQVMTNYSFIPNDAVVPDTVQSSVLAVVFQQFVSAFKGDMISFIDANFARIRLLSEELRFEELSTKLVKLESKLNSVEQQYLNLVTVLPSLSSPIVREELTVDGCMEKYF